MSPTTSKRTIRIQGLLPGTTLDQLQDAMRFPTKSHDDTAVDETRCFLAEQNEFMISTVTFGSAKGKSKATERLKTATQLEIDSDFIGLTVLRSCEDINLE